MAINTEITRISNAKSDIKSAIEAKGVSVPSNALIDTYDDYVAAIPSGGGGNDDLIDLIERDFTSLTIPSGTTKIGSSAFSRCTSLTSVTIPNGVTRIDNEAFYGCEHLNSVIIPSSVTRIDEQAFGYSGLPTITIPSSVTTIGQDAFKYCRSLVSVNFEANSQLTTLNSSVFSDCEVLTTVTIPNGVTRIDYMAFANCYALPTITIPSSVTSIAMQAFSYCTSLTTVTCEATTPPTMGNGVFQGCTNLAHIYVPASSVETYKAESGWSDYASIIEAIPSN